MTVTRQQRIDRTERHAIETHIKRAIEHAEAMRDRAESDIERDRFQAVIGNLDYACRRLVV